MKKISAILLILILLLTACKPRTGTQASSSEPKENASSANSEAMSSQPKESKEDSSQTPAESEEPEEEIGFYENVILTYGAEFAPGARNIGLMQVSQVGFFHVEDWTDPMKIESGAYYSWYLSMMWKEDLTVEERREKYQSPNPEDEGWFFPQELYESTIQEYFDVTTEHLRAERLIYDPELEGYYLGTGGGIGEGSTVSLDSVEENGDTAKVRMRIQSNNVEAAPEYKVLTIRLFPDGGFRFLSCETE